MAEIDKQLDKKMQQFQDFSVKVAELKQENELFTKETEGLKDTVEGFRVAKETEEKLISGLNKERVDLEKKIETLKSRDKKLQGDVGAKERELGILNNNLDEAQKGLWAANEEKRNAVTAMEDARAKKVEFDKEMELRMNFMTEYKEELDVKASILSKKESLMASKEQLK